MGFLTFIKNLFTCKFCQGPKEPDPPEIIKSTIAHLGEDLYEFDDYYYGDVESSDI